MIKALVGLFPNIGLDPARFVNVAGIPLNRLESQLIFNTAGHWQNKQNRRKMFELVAKRLNFDPLIASNWYNVTLKKLRPIKVKFALFVFIVVNVVVGRSCGTEVS